MSPWHINEESFLIGILGTMTIVGLAFLYAAFIPPDSVCMQYGRARFEKRERCVVWTEGEKHWRYCEDESR